MTNLVLEENIHIRYSDSECNGRLKPFSLLNFFQDMAAESAERLGFGYSAIYPQNLLWVLLKYRLEFTKYPVHVSQLTVKTEPRGYNRLFAYRNFEVYAIGNDSDIDRWKKYVKENNYPWINVGGNKGNLDYLEYFNIMSTIIRSNFIIFPFIFICKL